MITAADIAKRDEKAMVAGSRSPKRKTRLLSTTTQDEEGDLGEIVIGFDPYRDAVDRRLYYEVTGLKIGQADGGAEDEYFYSDSSSDESSKERR